MRSTYGVNRIIRNSQGRYESFPLNKFTILKEGTISKNLINTYLKSDRLPSLWRNFFLNIANNMDYVYHFCNRPFHTFDLHCREWYLYNNNDGDDIRMLNNEMNN